MNKKEKVLNEAIELGNKEEAIEALTAFASLKSTTDEKANDYFGKIQAIGEEAVELEEAIEDLNESETEEVEEEVIEVELPRVENRGIKPVSVGRKEVNDAFNNLYKLSINYFSDVKKESSAQSKFARRLVRTCRVMKKTIFR